MLRGGVTYQEVVRAIAETVGPLLTPIQTTVATLSEKVDRLSLGSATRIDMDGLRREMREGFTAIEARYYTREVSDQRYADVTRRLDEVEARLVGQESATDKREETDKQGQVATRNNVVYWAIGMMGLVATAISLLVTLASHFYFHP